MKKKVVMSIMAPALLAGSIVLPQFPTVAYAENKESIAAPKDDIIEFQDPGIKAAVKGALSPILGHSATDADLTQENLNKIKFLETAGSVTTLTDLVHLPNLLELLIAAPNEGAKVLDTTPLANLTKLEIFQFIIPDVQLSSLSPLKDIPLRILSIEAEPTVDNSETILGSLSSLRTLEIFYSTSKGIKTIGNLDNLLHLQQISLENFGLEEAPTLLGAKNLRYANFNNNNLSNVPDLSHCQKLIDLDVESNNIKDYTNVDKLLNLPNLSSISLISNLLTTYPAVAEKLNPNNLNANFIDGHGLSSQFAIKPINTQTIQQGTQVEIPIEWIDEDFGEKPFYDFTPQQKEFVKAENLNITTDNNNVSVTPQGSSIVIKAAEGVSGKTHINLSYGGDLTTAFDVVVN
ncbi:hypothetical protein [Listeria sp. PSOL-1]|uniref:hypothetical protein n=1 Tax=Listeria sp. PSOL-1 TaxID=1844999 RepID=UPI0013D7A9BD|nr:hypothetical protein [Listeria sp. PSOL-1]